MLGNWRSGTDGTYETNGKGMRREGGLVAAEMDGMDEMEAERGNYKFEI